MCVCVFCVCVCELVIVCVCVLAYVGLCVRSCEWETAVRGVLNTRNIERFVLSSGFRLLQAIISRHLFCNAKPSIPRKGLKAKHIDS